LSKRLDKTRKTLKRFVLDSVQLDALLDARARDVAFVERGGQLLYSPDQSTWSAFFFPVRDGQVHKDRKGNSILGFAEVFVDADRSDKPFESGSPLSGNQVTGMLGKVLIDAIFTPTEESEVAPDFFLTEESKAGLNEAIKAVLRARDENAQSPQVQQTVAAALSKLSKEFEKTDDLSKLLAESPKKLENILSVLLNDKNPVNINERAETYNRIGFVDWAYIESAVNGGMRGEDVLNFSWTDVLEYKRLVEEFSGIFTRHLAFTGSNNKNKINSMSEILALNAIVERARREDIRFAYLTNAPWAIRNFDHFTWDANSDTPLQPIGEETSAPTVSYLFVRTPLCFLHDIELRPEQDESESALKILMDSVVPKQLYDQYRLSISRARTQLLEDALNKLRSKAVKFFEEEVQTFYKRWDKKKTPWINEFLARKGAYWKKGLELFSREGFHGFWRHVNDDFARHSWQLGIYVAMMMDESAARAAPLTYIDCDDETNRLLSGMQAELSRGAVEKFQGKISEFIDRSTEGQSEERKRYFDSLVNAVLFMFSNQYKTSLLHTETACELAMKSNEDDLSGREAFYLRSHLMHITAQSREEIEMARKLLLVARSKLEIDNANLPEGAKVSTIRFDVEDWSRRIMQALADFFDAEESEREFPITILQKYLSFVRRATESKFFGLVGDEKVSLLARICERTKFNFMVLAVTFDSSLKGERSNFEWSLADSVEKWNQDFGEWNEHLSLKVDKDEYNDASTIEKAYLLALAVGAPKADFVDQSFDISGKLEDFYGRENRKTIVLACTSFIDNSRYKSLEKYCNERVEEREAAR